MSNSVFNILTTVLLINSFPNSKSSSQCITQRQQVEIPNCCQMEPLAPEHLLTKCEELVAADVNPGTDMYDVCLQKCVFEELGAIDGFEAHLEKLYLLAEAYPVDYRHAVYTAIAECSKLGSTECISKRQQTELALCCEIEEFIPRHIRTKCQEKAAAHHNPGSNSYDMCLMQCVFEELGAIDGYEVHLEMLYPVTDSFPVDYRQAVRLAIDKCNERLQNIQRDKPKQCQQCEEQCPIVGQQVARCLDAVTYNNCPISRWRASTACNKVRRNVPFC